MAEKIVLPCKFEFTLEPTSPFHFDATFHKPDHFPTRDHEWQPGIRWQTMVWSGEPLGLVFANRGNVLNPEIRLTVFSSSSLESAFRDELLAEITYRYNLNMDLRDFNDRFSSHASLGPVIQKWLGTRPMTSGGLYEYLMIAIVLQNATVRRSVNMMQALFEAYGRMVEFDGKELYCFWEPEAMHETTEQALRDLKVGYRAKAIRRVSEALRDRTIDEKALRDCALEEQRKALLGLYGVGPASVGYLLFDIFHQMDDMRTISPWEQKIYSKLFFNTDVDAPVKTEVLLTYFQEHFSGYRMLAVHYLWEDLFWKRTHERIDWLEQLIRL